MAQDLSVVFASNRGPVSFVRSGDEFETKRGAGGLAGALDPVARRLGDRASWVAAATSDTDRAALAAGATKELRSMLGYEVTLLDIDPSTYSRYYDEVSNRMLWFANHCLWDEMDIPPFGAPEVAAWQDAYEPVNRRFAEAVGQLADPDAVVLFQDYHLAVAPGFLRAADRQRTIFHFTHSSFCGARGLDRLPAPIPERLIRGMLGADLLGFHVPAWAHGFFSAAEAAGGTVDQERGLVERGGRTSWVRAYPIPIDTRELRATADGAGARTWAERFRSSTPGPLVVRADRVEPSKNIIRGFEAFGALLDRRADLARSARFIACLYPSRETMPEYQDYSDAVEAAAQAVNDRHPGAIELYTEDDFERTVGALCIYDVLLVNPIMDGMNLVSKEGPAVNQRDGVLVLSRGAGSFAEMGGDAIEVGDALDVTATALALEQALDLAPDERAARARRLRAAAGARTPRDWINEQLEDLKAIKARGAPATAAPA